MILGTILCMADGISNKLRQAAGQDQQGFDRSSPKSSFQRWAMEDILVVQYGVLNL